MPKSLIQWHPDVHKKWAHESLVFWRLGFYPTYRREAVLEALDVVCARHGITGRTVYEVFGTYDLLLRLWLPESAPTETVDLDLKRTLASFHLELCDHFEVEMINRHWFWSDDENFSACSDEDSGNDDSQGEPRLETPHLDPKPNRRELARVNELVDQFNTGKIDIDAVCADELAGELLEREVLRVREADSGIKFSMVVSTSGATASRYTAMESLGSVLAEILEEAGTVRERSLYSGTGFGRFMVLGKVPTEDFYELNRGLIEPITIKGRLANVYRTRSETYIGSNPDLQRFSESLAVPMQFGTKPADVDIKAILRGGETARVEFKGGVFSNIGRWLKTGNRGDDGRSAESFARAIVAMLNGTGGVIVSGVLERSIRHYDAEPKLENEPRLGDLIVLGLEFEWAEWKRQDVDEFKNRLRQKLETLIEPDPFDHISIEVAEGIEGRTIAYVSIAEDVPTWYYLRDGEEFRFAIRKDASSVIVSGPQEERYKRLRPRDS